MRAQERLIKLMDAKAKATGLGQTLFNAADKRYLEELPDELAQQAFDAIKAFVERGFYGLAPQLCPFCILSVLAAEEDVDPDKGFVPECDLCAWKAHHGQYCWEAVRSTVELPNEFYRDLINRLEEERS